MKESEARTKECPQHMLMMVLLQIEAGKEGASDEAVELISQLGFCSASQCMNWEPYNYWVKDGRYCTKETEGAEAVGGGDCGLKAKECGCSQ